MITKRVNVITHSYEDYKYKDDPTSKKHLSYKEYKEILLLFFMKFIYRLITTGDKITFPSFLGALQVVKFKSNKWNQTDYKATKDVYGEYNKDKPAKDKKFVTHTNTSTGGYWVTVHWYKRPTQDNKFGARFRNQSNYAFKLTRPNTRPNSYNSWNPEVSLFPYFKEVGHEIYKRFR